MPNWNRERKRILKPELCDVVMVCNPAKKNDAKYGIVVKDFKSEQTLIVRYKGDNKRNSCPYQASDNPSCWMYN